MPAARLAGKPPKNRPISTLKPSASGIENGTMTGFTPTTWNREPTTPARTPSSPPITDSSVASLRNCARITPGVAPMALRMPISRVRSVTVTSMMLVMPMPPTSSEIAATAPSSTVNVCAVEVAVDSTVDALSTSKSASAEVSLCRWSRVAVISPSTAVTCPGDLARTTTLLSEPKPVSWSCTVVSGATAVLSALPRPLEPFDASTPTTVNGMPATSTLCPTGLTVPNRSVATSLPMTTTSCAWVTSCWVKYAPWLSVSFSAGKYVGYVPVRLTPESLLAPRLSVSEVETTGEAVATPWSAARACASCTVRSFGSANAVLVDVAAVKPPAEPEVCKTVIELAPSEEMAFCTDWEEPLPTATSRITEPTPIRMPRVVSAERSLLADSPASANWNVCHGLTTVPPAW